MASITSLDDIIFSHYDADTIEINENDLDFILNKEIFEKILEEKGGSLLMVMNLKNKTYEVATSHNYSKEKISKLYDELTLLYNEKKLTFDTAKPLFDKYLIDTN